MSDDARFTPRRVLQALRRPRAEADDEIAFHIEMRAEELVARGVAPDEALRQAIAHFGDVERVRNEIDAFNTWEGRRMSIRESLEALRHDVAYATRSLRREPALAAGVVVTFALAIGATAAMFGLVRQLMLAPPPGITEPSRVAQAELRFVTDDGEMYTASTTSYPVFRGLASQTAAFSAVAASHADTILFGRGASATGVSSIAVTGEYFSALGARVALGRTLGPADDEAPDGNSVVVLGHAFWQRTFGGDRGVIGSEVVVEDQRFTVVGVAAQGFNGDQRSTVDLFLPLNAAMRDRGGAWRSEDHLNVVTIVARLRDGVTFDAASAAASRALRDGVGSRELAGVELESVVPGRSARQSQQARIARWLSGVSWIVLLIATANVATLLLLRAVRRRREVAVRIALGISRARLVRQLLTESLLLASIGAGAGLFVARWLSDVIRATLIPNLAPSERLVEPQVLLVSLGAAMAAGLLAGLAPLAQLAKPQITNELHAGAAPGSRHHSRAQRTLVGLQVALCTVLLVGAGLFVRSLDRIRSQDLGYNVERLLFATIDFRGALRGSESDAAHVEIARRLEQVAGVSGATVVEAMPFGFHHIPPISVPGHDRPPTAGGQLPIMYAATPKYLEFMDVKLLRGRLFDARDRRGSPYVVLVNETMARETWPGESAIGKCIRAGMDWSQPPTPLAPKTLPCREVVGVVRDSRARSLLPRGRETSLMQYYVPFGQIPEHPNANASYVNALLIRVTGDPERMAPLVQQAIQGASATPTFARVSPYQDLLDPQLRPWRLGATLFSTLGALAMAIAAVGLFGVVSYVVSQRRKEIGVRLALGGTPSVVAGLVLRLAVRMVAVGVAVGTLVALIAAPAVQSMLFATSAREVGVIAGAALLLTGVAIAAALVPAWRASRVSPLTALQSD
jgi:predicted permease